MRTLALLGGTAAFLALFFAAVLLAAGCATADEPDAPAADNEAARNMAALQRIYGAFSTGDTAAIDSVIAPDAVDHQALPGAQGTTNEQLKQFVGMFRAAFPDLRVTVDHQFAAADHVVAVITLRGTHQGDFMGIAPTGRTIEVSGIDVVRFENGMAVEHWGVTNDLEMMQQLGVVPMPEAPPGGAPADTARAGA